MAALVALVGCSGGTREAPAAQAGALTLPTDAELAYLQAEGREPFIRQMAVTDYFLHYYLMEATGITEALGGEEQAIAALKAVGEAHERQLAWAKNVAPRMIPASFTGEGMTAGMYGFGTGAAGGFLASAIISGLLGSELSDSQFAQVIKDMEGDGPIRFADENGSLELKIGEDGSYEQAIESNVEKNGVKGKLKVRIRMDGCPDSQGKMTVKFDIDSQMSVAGKEGTGGYVRAQYEKDAWLDDDAHLDNTADGRATDLKVEMGGFEDYKSQHFEGRATLRRGAASYESSESSKNFSIFRPSEVESLQNHLKSIVDSLDWITEVLLRGLGKNAPWESGRCVDIEVKTNPEKRTGADPGLNYKITVIPRARSDGQVTTGTVRATLGGDSSLDPADTKVKVEADVKFDYANPKEKDKKASIDFEARSKRGVGRATANFDTEEKNSYRIESALCPGGGTETMDVCDVTKPFSVTFCGGTSTVRHTPSGEKGGTFSFRYTGPHGHAQNTGTYTLSGEKGRLTATYANSPVCFTMQGQTLCQPAPSSSVTWTKIDDCEG